MRLLESLAGVIIHCIWEEHELLWPREQSGGIVASPSPLLVSLSFVVLLKEVTLGLAICLALDNKAEMMVCQNQA